MARELYYGGGGGGARDYAPRPPRVADARVLPPRTVTFYAVSLVVIAILVPLRSVWAVQLVLVLLLLTIPGLLLLRALHVPAKVITDFPALVPSASVCVLLCTGLALDVTGPLVAIAAPLRPVPILGAFEVVCIGLLCASVDAGPEVDIRWKAPQRPALLLLPLVLPLVTAAGALRLNNGHSNKLAVAAL